MPVVEVCRRWTLRPCLTALCLLLVGCGADPDLRRIRVSLAPWQGWQTAAIAPRTLAEVDHLEIRLVPDQGWPSAGYATAAGTSARLKPQGTAAQMVFDQVPPGTYRVVVRAFEDAAETRNITRIAPDLGGQVAVSAAAATVAVGLPVRYSQGDRLAVAVGMLDGVGDRLDVGLTFKDGNPNPPITVEVLAS
jgi:hypothetical protein